MWTTFRRQLARAGFVIAILISLGTNQCLAQNGGNGSNPGGGGSEQAQYDGTLEHAGCDTISGWAVNTQMLTTVVSVQIWDGGFLDPVNGIVAANAFDANVAQKYGAANGMHGFSIATPASFKDGQLHQLHVRFNGSPDDLQFSPATIGCGSAPNVLGAVEHFGCDGVSGYAADRMHPNVSLNIPVYDGQTLLTVVSANQLRPDLAFLLSDNRLHGFSWSIPPALQDHTLHVLSFRFPGNNADLANSPVYISCGPAQAQVIFNLACGQVNPGAVSVGCDGRTDTGVLYDAAFPATLAAGDRYTVRLFNIDDHERVIVNGILAGSADYGQDVTIDITSFMNVGTNTIELIAVNDSGPWTDGFTVIRIPAGAQ